MIYWPVQAQAFLFSMLNIQGEKFAQVIFMKNMFNVGLCLDAYELISFKLGMMMIDMTKLLFDTSV